MLGWAVGFELLRAIENRQVVDFTKRQKREKRQIRRSEVHGGYTAVRVLIFPLTSEAHHQLCDPSCTLWSANPARELNHDGSVR